MVDKQMNGHELSDINLFINPGNLHETLIWKQTVRSKSHIQDNNGVVPPSNSIPSRCFLGMLFSFNVSE